MERMGREKSQLLLRLGVSKLRSNRTMEKRCAEAAGSALKVPSKRTRGLLGFTEKEEAAGTVIKEITATRDVGSSMKESK